MKQSFEEIVIGDVVGAPFVSYAGAALLITLLLRPVLARIGFARLFTSIPIAMLCLYIMILALLIVMA
jgi:hypothetical protein